MKTLAAIVLALFALAYGPIAAARADSSERIVVVVGDESPIRHVSLDVLRELYLKRRRQWSSGEPAVPINLPVGEPTRAAFSKRVLGRYPKQLLSYWDRQYYDGIRPPIVLPSASAVRAYVQADANAIGYVPASEATDGCRIVLTIEP